MGRPVKDGWEKNGAGKKNRMNRFVKWQSICREPQVGFLGVSRNQMRSRERKMGPERVEMPRPWKELNAMLDVWPTQETVE